LLAFLDVTRDANHGPLSQLPTALRKRLGESSDNQLRLKSELQIGYFVAWHVGLDSF